MNSYVRTDNGLSYTGEDMERWMDSIALKEANLRVYGKEVRPQHEETRESQKQSA